MSDTRITIFQNNNYDLYGFEQYSMTLGERITLDDILNRLSILVGYEVHTPINGFQLANETPIVYPLILGECCDMDRVIVINIKTGRWETSWDRRGQSLDQLVDYLNDRQIEMERTIKKPLTN